MVQSYKSIKDDVLAKLERELPILRKKYGVNTIGIFGSVSRGEDTIQSDVDVLYSFEEGRGNLHEFVGLANHLEDLFNRKVELVSLEYVDPYLKSFIKNDAILYGDTRGIA